jgi:hypothetical protein
VYLRAESEPDDADPRFGCCVGHDGRLYLI